MDLLRFVLSIAVGFVIGYAHTGVAIVMLFRPFEEIRFLGVRLQGMIPRRRAEMARSVARIFASDLLREESVAERVAGPDVRRAAGALADELLGRFLNREYGTLRQSLGPVRSGVAERALGGVAAEAGLLLREWLASVPGRAVLRSSFELLLERSPSQLLPGEEAALSRLAAARALEALASPGLEGQLRQVLGRLLARASSSARPLGDLLPSAARGALLGALRDSVPALLKRFEQALMTPQNVEKLKGAVRSGVRAYLTELEGGFLKNLVRRVALLGRERVLREVDEVVDANLYRLGELVYEEENRAHVEAGVCEALEAFLSKTPGDLFASVAPEAGRSLVERAAAWSAGQLRRPEVAEALARGLERELSRAFQSPLRELAERAGLGGEEVAERLARAAERWAAGGGLEALVRREAGALSALVLDVPIGRPSRFVSADVRREAVSLALEHLVPAVARNVPEILRIVDVEGLIEREVLLLPARELERVIVSVAKRELGAIAWWGGVLGALVGGTQNVLQRFVF